LESGPAEVQGESLLVEEKPGEEGVSEAEEPEDSPRLAPGLVVVPEPVANQVPCVADTPPYETPPLDLVALPTMTLPAGRGWEPAQSSPKLDHLVEAAPGDVLTILAVVPHLEDRPLRCEWPRLQPDGEIWREIRTREARRRKEPPMAGLRSISGPQTLRIVVPLSKPEPTPEQPVAAPNTKVELQQTARTAGPRMGAIRALRTRIGTQGRLKPHAGDEPGPLLSLVRTSPAMPRMRGLAGESPVQAAGEAEEVEESPASTGSQEAGNLRLEAWMLPRAGFRSLGGGPLDRVMKAVGCPGGMPPFDMTATRRLLGSLYSKRVPVPLPETRDAAVMRAEASEKELAPAGTMCAGATGFRAESCQLGEGAIIPGYRLVISIDPRTGPVRWKPVTAAEIAFSMPAPAAPSPAMPWPRLAWGSCVAGVRTRDWEAMPRSGVEPPEEGGPIELRPPAMYWRRRPLLSAGRLAALESGGWAQSGELSLLWALFSQPGDAEGDRERTRGGLRAVLPSGAGAYPRAGVPRVGRSLRHPVRFGDGGGLPILEPVSCSFASGGALWDSLI
jgi:hypothetical protein